MVKAMRSCKYHRRRSTETRQEPVSVEKFRPTFGALYWPSTWRQLHFANFDRSVLDFSWKVAHGVLYPSVLYLFACMCLSSVFVVQFLSR